MPIKHSTPEDLVDEAGFESFPVVADVFVSADPDIIITQVEERENFDDLAVEPRSRAKLIAIGAGALFTMLVAGAIVWRIRAR